MDLKNCLTAIKVTVSVILIYTSYAALPIEMKFVTHAVSFHPLTGLAVPLGIVFGIPGIIGVTLGPIIAAPLGGGLHPMIYTIAAAYFLMSLIGALLRTKITTDGVQALSLVFEFRFLKNYLRIALLASVAGASMVGWLSEFSGQSFFFISAPRILVEAFLTTILIGLPLLIVLRIQGFQSYYRGLRIPSNISENRLAIPLLTWLLLATFASLGMVMSGFIPEWVLGNYRLAVVPAILDITRGGRWIQIALGSFILSWIAVIIRTSIHSNPTQNSQ